MTYFESTLWHFGVFVVKHHPLLDDTANAGLWVVDKLEASDVRPTFPQVSQVDIQETLTESGQAERRTRSQECAWLHWLQPKF